MAHRQLKLIFEPGSELSGHEVVVEGMTAGEWMTQEPKPLTVNARLFCERLVSWTLVDDDGQPLPPTSESFAGLDARLAKALVLHWFREATCIPPLARPAASMNGAMEDSLPMSPAG